MVYILGCDHYLHEYGLTESEGKIRKIEYDLKKTCYSIIEDLIRTHGIQLIGEECRPAQHTVARALARELGCKYAEIDMPGEQREAMGIAKDYQSREGEEDRGYVLRENYMLQRIYSESTARERKLIVCGVRHMKGLAEGFERHGEQLTTRDLTKEEWCATGLKRRLQMLLSEL